MTSGKGVERVRALLSPRNIAIVGASDRKGSWSLAVWQSLRLGGYAGPVYPVNPRNESVWDGVPCHQSLDALPEKPDHVVVLVPGRIAIETIRQAGRAGARSATIFSGGFGEGGDEAGRALGRELEEAIRESGLAVSGPNCVGNVSAPHRLCTMVDSRFADMAVGPVGMVGQSGGVVGALYRALLSRGVAVTHAITSGNEAGLTSADYIRFMAADPEIRVICCYIEAIRDLPDFLDACGAARAAGKPVLVMKIGGSEASRGAALAHTGMLAGALACFDAVTRPLGIIRAETVDELVELAEYFGHAEVPKGPRLGAMTFSGGLNGLLLEAAERHGIVFPPLSAATREKLQQHLDVGTSIGNPLDAGFAALSSADAYFKCVEIMLDEPGIDALILQEELPQREGLNAKAAYLRTVDEMVRGGKRKPVAVMSFASYMYSDFAREFRAGFPHLAVLHEIDKSLKALARAGAYGRLLAQGPPEPPPRRPLGEAALRLIGQAVPAPGGRLVLGEAHSKELLALYGIAAPREIQAADEAAAVVAAKEIGFPIVLKLVSDDLQHKSDVGGVLLDLKNEDEVRSGFGRIRESLERARPGAHFGGILVARQVAGGLEMVLGIHRDPEVGLVSMAGTGGLLLELQKDVRFGTVPLDAAQAEAMIEATMAGRLLEGYRGAVPRDAASVRAALAALAQLAADLGDRLDSIDVNPMAVLPVGQGAFALDALVVLRQSRDQSSSVS